MRPLVVCDASAVVALLVDGGADGRWAARVLGGADLAAPTMLPFEVDNVLRRLELAGRLTTDQAAQAHVDLLDLPVELWPHELLARRAWALRSSLTTYDASYVALAELLDLPLVTADGRLARAPGVRCPITVVPR